MTQVLELATTQSRSMIDGLRSFKSYWALPARARAAYHADVRGLPLEDPGPRQAAEEALAWLSRAQDMSPTHDGGFAADYSLLTGWSASYPETTGYIIPTLLSGATVLGDRALRKRARAALDWLVSIQYAEGGFQGGLVDREAGRAVAFNTGQVLFGLAAGTVEFGDAYREPMRRAADWLVSAQGRDGSWRWYDSPYAAAGGEKAYEMHIAWALFEAARLEPGRGYAEAGMANVSWALALQRSNGWFDRCCLNKPTQPLTHTIGYALRGLVEAYRFTHESSLLAAAMRTADGLLRVLRQDDGFLSGRLDEDWQGVGAWACLTGSVQVALCWFALFEFTGNKRYLHAGLAATQYVRRTVLRHGSPDAIGAVKGAFPINGGYGAYRYLSWACKFYVDANMAELRLGSSSLRSSRHSPAG